MSLESWKSSKFTFQSSVHSSHLLQSLNEQRKKDLLCDVTVVVENQSFRAHRAVLASCSDFFSARVSSLATPEGLVINLPVEVTAEGFEPLLEFAYTSKLTFSKENVLDLRNCTSVLGFKNLDKACFDFLLPKFFDSSRGTSNLQRKQCCKIKCCKARETGNDVIDENKAVPQPSLSQQKEQSLSSSTPTEDATGSQNVQSATDYSRLCPKYRKFQIACGKERQGLDVCGLETATVSKGPDDNCPSNCLPCSGNEDCSRSTIWDSGDLSKNQEMSSFDSCYTNTEACPPTQSTTSRSKDEMEVAKQLTDLPDIYSTQASPSGLGLRCQKTWHLDPKAEECLFMQSFGAKLHDVEVGATSHGSPYVPCNQSEDDSDSVDTEGDSESYSIEQLYKMALPLSVDQIVSLSRNDFQQMLKQQCLTREQLNAVHDIRRRSKNRIAARRCRKRKLDCINNLECEIQKLRSEHENLMAERIQLNQLKIKTWQSYSGLYERVCSEAALKPEQLQVLAKYSSPDCPLSAFLYSSTDLPQCPELQPQTSTSSRCFSTRTCCSEAKAPLASLIGKSDGVDQSSSKNLLPTRLAETQSHTCPADASCCSSLNLGTDLICQQERNK